ncbi:4-hydroxyphenylacetate 3-hydroxylase C-terminal domain-containing protein [Geobacillus subterraneus]|uniref:4-hydroxyphenylacetate 3-hydroxylase C-terminal domain-containing protein n=1 Tax=Geobacillus subterraneus TaxID=129338 RepID=UPI002AC956B9|nr:4-hydroxyphenylacetate 3-hydroxylase C-terminal domain-containing protein [Geobacillus subterraneus]WPZ17103.1 4-hydroxyphenylacetate 3-hydroxylase C-terminal domain-containing protein [Geobacillus subterraneus]
MAINGFYGKRGWKLWPLLTEPSISSALTIFGQIATLPAEQRVQLFRFAWDLVMSAFGTRQTLYERFFFGDPARFATTFYHRYDREACAQMVRRFLDSEQR